MLALGISLFDWFVFIISVSLVSDLSLISSLGMRKRKHEVTRALCELGIPNSTLVKLIGTLNKYDLSNDVLSQLDDRMVFDRALDRSWKNFGDNEPIRLELTEEKFGNLHYDWWIGSVPKMLSHYCGAHLGFRRMLSKAFAARPCTPQAP